MAGKWWLQSISSDGTNLYAGRIIRWLGVQSAVEVAHKL